MLVSDRFQGELRWHPMRLIGAQREWNFSSYTDIGIPPRVYSIQNFTTTLFFSGFRVASTVRFTVFSSASQFTYFFLSFPLFFVRWP